jgi:hypothetical protein
MVFVLLIIYFLTYSKINIVYWGNETFLIIKPLKKRIESFNIEEVVYIEKKKYQSLVQVSIMLSQ